LRRCSGISDAKLFRGALDQCRHCLDRQTSKKSGEVVGYSGCFIFDTSKPDGMPRKLLDSSRMLKTGWRARNALDDGLAQTYQWFLAHELMADSTRHYAAH
jgi:hypothetical protein